MSYNIYVLFKVRTLLTCCTHDFTNGGSWYYKISSKRMKAKEVHITSFLVKFYCISYETYNIHVIILT